MGDAFFRWDGFSYYASFSEFIPSVALAFILWNIVALFFAIILWGLFRILEWICRQAKLNIRIDHLLLSACMFLLLGVLTWKTKKLLWPDIQTTFQIKLAVLSCVVFLSIYLTWLFRNRAERWVVIVHERITPLMWLFGTLILISVPVVAYHAFSTGADKTVTEENLRDSGTLKTRPNIILVTFDALAARHMSVYGYERDTTPFIKNWANNATLFAMAEAGSNFTTPAAATLMTGKRVWTHQTYHIAGSEPVRSDVESLPSVLKGQGYFNMAFVVNPFASVRILGMSDSFDVAPLTSELGRSVSLFGWKFGIIDVMLYRAFGDKIRMHNWIVRNDFILSKVINLISRNISQTTVPPETAFNRFINILDENSPRPFFAWIHIFPPHDPYLPPELFMERYNPSRELRTYKNQEELIEKSYKYLFQYRRFPETMKPKVDLMRDYYDEFITYIDNEFKNFITELHKREVDNTVVLLSSDHGESFGHGYFTHGGPFLYEQVTHIPLIIKKTGQTAGQIVDQLVEQIDIPATVLEFAEIPVPSWMEGRSLVPLMRGETLPQRPSFSMNFEGNRSRWQPIESGSIAVWDGEYKLIHYLEKNESLLFNLKEDPDELDNLFLTQPDVAKKLRGLIMSHLDKANERIKKNSERFVLR
jgi:arylsulfatase A-like enzyme